MRARFLVCALAIVVLALSGAASADTILLQEDFEGAAPPTAVWALPGVPGWPGTTRGYKALISSATIDSGQSANWPTGPIGWEAVGQVFSHTPSTGDIYTLTGVLTNTADSGSNSSLYLTDSFAENYYVGVSMGWNYFNFGSWHGANAYTLAATPSSGARTVDVKIVVQDNQQDYFYRTHGSSAWTSLGSTAASYALSNYKQVEVDFNPGYTGGIDSIKLVVSSVPEPSSLVLLSAGLMGLLAYAWKRRR